MDASYFINTSCLSLFRPGRRLDLILSFDYCLDSPFEVPRELGAPPRTGQAQGRAVSGQSLGGRSSDQL